MVAVELPVLPCARSAVLVTNPSLKSLVDSKLDTATRTGLSRLDQEGHGSMLR